MLRHLYKLEQGDGPRDEALAPYTDHELAKFAAATGKVLVRRRLKYRKMLWALAAKKPIFLATDTAIVEFKPMGKEVVVTTKIADPINKFWSRSTVKLPAAKARAKYASLLELGFKRW